MNLGFGNVLYKCREEHGYLWAYFAKKGEEPRWHFMGSIHHFKAPTYYFAWDEAV